MRSYRIQGIDDSIATAVRESMKSPQYGHPVHTEIATGYGPCRLCLQTFEVGADERLLFTYQPFTDPAALPAPGPVFIHRAPCERYDGPDLPAALRSLPLVLEGYGADGAPDANLPWNFVIRIIIALRYTGGSIRLAATAVYAHPMSGTAWRRSKRRLPILYQDRIPHAKDLIGY